MTDFLDTPGAKPEDMKVYMDVLDGTGFIEKLWNSSEIHPHLDPFGMSDFESPKFEGFSTSHFHAALPAQSSRQVPFGTPMTLWKQSFFQRLEGSLRLETAVKF